MFFRVRHDQKGLEPRKLFNLAEFMMVDKDCSGSIDIDECMEILYRRFGNDAHAQESPLFWPISAPDGVLSLFLCGS
mgnify:CR=1 FL=1